MGTRRIMHGEFTLERGGRCVTSAFEATLVACCVLGILAAGIAAPAGEAELSTADRLTSNDAYIAADGCQWTLGTAAVEKVIALEDGRLLVKSLKNKLTGRELAPPGESFEEITSAVVGLPGEGPWALTSARPSKLAQGELQLELTLSRGPLAVTQELRDLSRIEHHSRVAHHRQRGPAADQDRRARLSEPGGTLAARPGQLDFHWMTGGENQPGSWMLKTEKLDPAKPRTFDSYEPFPARRRRRFPATASTPRSR